MSKVKLTTPLTLYTRGALHASMTEVDRIADFLRHVIGIGNPRMTGVRSPIRPVNT